MRALRLGLQGLSAFESRPLEALLDASAAETLGFPQVGVISGYGESSAFAITVNPGNGEQLVPATKAISGATTTQRRRSARR